MNKKPFRDPEGEVNHEAEHAERRAAENPDYHERNFDPFDVQEGSPEDWIPELRSQKVDQLGDRKWLVGHKVTVNPKSAWIYRAAELTVLEVTPPYKEEKEYGYKFKLDLIGTIWEHHYPASPFTYIYEKDLILPSRTEVNRSINDQIEASNKRIMEEYPVQDDVWPSRRWKADGSDFRDMSGFHPEEEPPACMTTQTKYNVLKDLLDTVAKDHPEFQEEHTTGWDMMMVGKLFLAELLKEKNQYDAEIAY